MKFFLVTGSCSALLGVALGAFAAHVLKERLAPDMYNVFEVGVRYHLYHAFALFVVAWAVQQFPESAMGLAGWLFIAGTILFSGSLYAMSLSGLRWLGAITPFGGVCFLAGWLALAWKFWRAV
jgi:uncharacterized membrane protein YgdD (TMEM256/DUF423 family)